MTAEILKRVQNDNKRLVGTEGKEIDQNAVSSMQKAENINGKKLVNTEEAARIAKVDERTIRRWFVGGKIQGQLIDADKGGGKAGQKLMIEKESLVEYLKIKQSTEAKKTLDSGLRRNDKQENQNKKPDRFKVHRGEPGCRVVTQFKDGAPILNDELRTINDEQTEHPTKGGDLRALHQNGTGRAVGQLAVESELESPPLQNPQVVFENKSLKVINPKLEQIGYLRFAILQKLREELTKEYPETLPLFKNGNGKPSKTKTLQKFLDLYNSGILLPEIHGELGSISRATLYNWIAATDQDGINGLIPQHGRAGISKITEHEKNLVLTLLLHQNRLKIAYAITLTKEYLKKKNYESPSSPATLRRFVDQFKKERYDIWVRKREGDKALNDKVIPYAERNPNLLEVGDGLVADGHRLNFQVINPWTGKPCRAAMVLFWDWRSSYPLGWELMLEESTQCVASALRNAILALGKSPKWVYLDNGKAFKAKIFTEDIDFEDTELPGMFARLNINYHFAQPYNAQAKPIERLFGVLNEQLERLIPSYTGASIEDKPAWTKRNEKYAQSLHNPYVPTIEETNDLIRAWRDRYAERPSRSRDGLRPIDIYNDGKGPGVDPNELTYLMMDREIKHIHRNGVTWLGWHWFDEALYGLKDKVVIRYSLSDLSQIYIFHKNEFLCTAKPIEKVNPMASESGTPKDMEAVKEVLRLKKRVKNTTRKLCDLLDSRAAGQIDWSRSKTPGISETIQKIEETKKPKVINISPFAGAPEPEMPVEEKNEPLRFPSASARYEYHLSGGQLYGPVLDNKFIEDYRSGKIAPGEWAAIYGEKVRAYGNTPL